MLFSGKMAKIECQNCHPRRHGRINTDNSPKIRKLTKKLTRNTSETHHNLLNLQRQKLKRHQMEFNEVILNRHSVRRFADKPVDRALVDQLIAVAQTAPSSKNCKSSGFMVVEDPDTIKALSQMRTSGCAFMDKAPVVIVVLGDSELSDMWVENSSISATFLQLAATANGLGSCWVQVRGRDRSKDGSVPGTAEDYVRQLLGVRDGMSILCLIALGYEAPAE